MNPVATAAQTATRKAASARRWLRLIRMLPLALVAMIAATAFALPGNPAAAQPASLQKDFPLPPTLAGFNKGEVTDFETKKAGLGYGINYGRSGWRADIYIYDMGLAFVPTGPKNKVMDAQLERAKQDILAVQKAGGYSNVQIKRSFEVKDANGKPAFSCIALQLVRQDMGASDSFLCLTGAAGKFVKVRISTAQSADSADTAERFLKELAGILPK